MKLEDVDQLAKTLVGASNQAKELTPDHVAYIRVDLEEARANLDAVLDNLKHGGWRKEMKERRDFSDAMAETGNLGREP